MITLIATVAAVLFILWTISNAAGRKKPDKGEGGTNRFSGFPKVPTLVPKPI